MTALGASSDIIDGSIFTCLVLVNSNLKNFPGIGYRFNQAGKSRARKCDLD